jgi:hypothetical protein
VSLLRLNFPPVRASITVSFPSLFSNTFLLFLDAERYRPLHMDIKTSSTFMFANSTVKISSALLKRDSWYVGGVFLTDASLSLEEK